MVTLDTTVLGWRTRDLELAYLPFLRGKGIAQYTSDPVFQRLLDEEPPGPPGAAPRPGPAALGTLFQLIRNYPERFNPAARARPSSASSRCTRARRSPGRTCRSCASAPSCRSS